MSNKRICIYYEDDAKSRSIFIHGHVFSFKRPNHFYILYSIKSQILDLIIDLFTDSINSNKRIN